MKTLACATLLAAALPLHAADSSPAWERLKSLVGEWEGSYTEAGQTLPNARVSYRLVSGGSALLETMDEGGKMEMVTVYHRDADTLLMTHYCAIGNQSRMRAQALRGGRLEFAFVDASNLKSPSEHVMARLVMRFPTADRLTHEWTSIAKGKEATGRFEFRRK